MLFLYYEVKTTMQKKRNFLH